MYRTGDAARHLRDGRIEFLYRLDNQVKVRGFRVEPSEVEAVLGELPGIRHAVVAVRADPDRGKSLAAYVVAEDGGTEDGVRAALRQRLPEYMVPSELTVIDKLPLTANGKVDRRALLRAAPQPSRVHIAPRTRLEQTVGEVWAEVLGLERVGVEDDFFELGGHSLLATQVVARLRRNLDLDLELRWLFEHRTVAALAEAIEAAGADLRAPAEPAITPVARELVSLPDPVPAEEM
jgi:acyl carrier protein